MIVWSPKMFEGVKSISNLCQNFDIASTILELAEVDVPKSFEPIMLLPYLQGKTDKDIREYVFSEIGRDLMLFDDVEQMTMIRSEEYKLVHLCWQRV